MLMNDPQKFDRVAREWAVKYAGAPRKNDPESTGSNIAPAMSAKSKIRKSSEAEMLARYDIFFILALADLLH